MEKRTKSSNKKSTMKLTEKEKYSNEKSREEQEFIETNMPNREN